MANTRLGPNTKGLNSVSLDTSAILSIGDASTEFAGVMMLNIIIVGTVSLTLRAGLHGSSVAAAAGSAPATVWYEEPNAGTTAVAAGTAITASKQVKVYLDGRDLFLDYTHTSGGATIIEFVPLRG